MTNVELMYAFVESYSRLGVRGIFECSRVNLHHLLAMGGHESAMFLKVATGVAIVGRCVVLEEGDIEAICDIFAGSPETALSEVKRCLLGLDVQLACIFPGASGPELN